MTEEKVTGFEETEVQEVESVIEEAEATEEVIEETIEEITEEIVPEVKNKGGKGLVINAILTGVMIVVLIANLIVSFENSKKLKEVEDVKVVLSYALTGDPSIDFDFAETANEIREQKKMIEEYMKEMEEEAPAEEAEEAPAEEAEEAPAEEAEEAPAEK